MKVFAAVILCVALHADQVIYAQHSNHSVSLSNKKMKNLQVYYRTVKIGGLDIFYREAGNKEKPSILLLHGFPASSHMYRDLINDLAGSFHVIAPDYPGFGASEAPSRKTFTYSFDNLTAIIEQFIDRIGLTKFSLYLQDYGGPVGFKIASRRPSSIQALILQNANAYLEGIGPAFSAVPEFWKNRNAETEKPVRAQLTLEGTKFQYLDGVADATTINPDAYVYDQYLLDRTDNNEIQMDLFYDYRHNVPLYPVWQEYLKQYQPPTLITWGMNDKFFTAQGAKAYLQHLPNAELHLLNSGHFALEEFHTEIAGFIKSFFERKGLR